MIIGRLALKSVGFANISCTNNCSYSQPCAAGPLCAGFNGHFSLWLEVGAMGALTEGKKLYGAGVNPFADALRGLRLRRGLRQIDLAELVGVSRKAITAVENGEGLGVKIDLIARLSSALSLEEGERRLLEETARRSQRVYAIPDETSPGGYHMVRELFDRLDRLTGSEIEAIRLVLKMHSDRAPDAAAARQRLVRKDKVWRSEDVP